MKTCLLSILLSVLFLNLLAQQSVPVFATREDSSNYYQLQVALQNIRQQGAKPNVLDATKMDSLSNAFRQAFDKIVGYRYVYEQSKGTTSYLSVNTDNAKEIKRLSLHDYKGRKFPKELAACSNIEELELVNTRIGKLPTYFKHFTKLKELNILNNYPSRGSLKLNKNASIKELNIRSDRSSALPTRYKQFKNLEILDLTRCQLTKMPDLRGNVQLKKLVLIENKLTLTNDQLNPLPRLEELNLQKNNINVLPEAIGQYTTLKKLFCNYNAIEALPPSIKNLSQLEQLTLYKNNVSSLPPEFYQLKNLRGVDLYYNKLTKIEDGIGNLDKLEILYLSFNELTALPESIGQLSLLRELYLHHNRLSYLPDQIRLLSKLNILRINDNAFTEFPYAILDLKNLENLDLSKNQLRTLPAELTSLAYLQLLSVGENPWENQDEVLTITESLKEKGVNVHVALKDGIVK